MHSVPAALRQIWSPCRGDQTEAVRPAETDRTSLTAATDRTGVGAALRDNVASDLQLSGNSSAPQPLEQLGDVVISVETALRQAGIHGQTLDEELCLLTVHGVLHLLGYDDMTDEGAEEMQMKERALGVRS